MVPFMTDPKIRLYLDHPLGQGQRVPLSRAQAHYLFGVMRLGEGAQVLVFDGRSGEWRAEVAEAGKRGGTLEIHEQTRPLAAPPDLWLLFAPVKKARTDFIVEKAVEMGVARICPVQTEFTNSARIQRERLQATAVEAAEQCGATLVPEVADLVRLPQLLDAWDASRRLMFCDEAADGGVDLGAARGPWAVLIGPEGGFSEQERVRLRALPFASSVRLGPRILRAETAAVAALTLWQTRMGDW
jgi:16S rRNA (uracil1498-N3)-methyltransferase